MKKYHLLLITASIYMTSISFMIIFNKNKLDYNVLYRSYIAFNERHSSNTSVGPVNTMLELPSQPGRVRVPEKTVPWETSVGQHTWIPHLCPRFEEEAFPGHQKLTWAPPTEDSIYFLQASCRTWLVGREACAVESAARHHPHRPLFLLMALPVLNHTHPLMQVVSGLKNVKVAWLDLDEVFSEEPMREWHRNRLWMLSRHLAVMVSDGTRAELLRRYGGTYIDLDAITLRPLPSATNWMARLAEDVITTGILSFEARHSLWQAFVNDIPGAFEPSGYLSIGALLLTQHVQRLCPAAVNGSVSHDQLETCGNFTIWPRRLFYPTHNQAPWEIIFKDGEGLGSEFFKTNDAYSLHLYNHISGEYHPHLAGDSIVREAARRNCPQVLRALKEQRTYL